MTWQLKTFTSLLKLHSVGDMPTSLVSLQQKIDNHVTDTAKKNNQTNHYPIDLIYCSKQLFEICIII